MEKVFSKSIDELNEIAKIAAKSTVNDLNYIDPRLIVIKDGHNVRNFSDPRVEAHIVELMANIKQNGVMTPLECLRGEKLETPYIDPKNGKEYPQYQWIVVDGQCRLTAVQRLLEQGVDIRRVPVMGVPQGSNEANHTFDMINANVGLRFTPIELAHAYKRLRGMHYEVDEIAEKLGKSVQHVNQCLDLLEYDKDIQDALKEGKITANNVRQVEKSVKETITDKGDRIAEVEKRLQEAMERAKNQSELNGVDTKAVKAGKFIETKKCDSETLADQLDAVLDALPKRDSYKLTELEELYDMLKSGHPIKNSINTVFGIKVGKTGTDE
jgi:ParB/RepB/Spo0J family partition protein